MRTPLAKLAAATAVVTYLLVVLGAVVRATGSGLGCPDWPTCHGSWIPPLEREALVEYSHRTVAALAGLLVVAVAVTAWRSRKQDQRSWLLSLAGLGLVVLQGWLGRQVVLTELSAPLVAIHLGTAMALLGLLLLIARRGAPEPDPAVAVRMWLGVAAVFVVVLGGAIVRGSGASLAFVDWPLMDGALVPAGLDVTVRLLHFLHRLLALAAGVYLGYLWLFLRSRVANAATSAGWALALYAAQAGIGAAAVGTLLDPWTVVAHVALAALTWSVVVLLPFSSSPVLVAD